MNKFAKMASLICTIAALAISSVEASAADPASELAALHAVDQAWVKAYNAGDVDGVAGLYDENAMLLPPGAPGASGRAAIRAFFAKDIPASQKDGVMFTLGAKPDGGVSGNLGWVSGTYVVKDKTGKVLDAGKYLSVSTKKNGKWLYLRDTWNSDGSPPPAPAPAATKK